MHHHLLVGDARVRVDDVLLLLVQDGDGLAQAEELLVEVVKLHLREQNEKVENHLKNEREKLKKLEVVKLHLQGVVRDRLHHRLFVRDLGSNLRLALDFKFRIVALLKLLLAKVPIDLLLLHLLLVDILRHGLQLWLPLPLDLTLTFAATAKVTSKLLQTASSKLLLLLLLCLDVCFHS